MKTEKIYVVYDGSSSYILPESEYIESDEKNELEILKTFFDIDKAQNFADRMNDQIIDKI
jgi:hypothetical protein